MEQSIYFEAQTGLIRDHPPSYTNYGIYELPASLRPTLEKYIGEAKLGSGGLEYNREFLDLLPIWERQWRQKRARLWLWLWL